MAENGLADNLTPAQHKAVSALLTEASVRKAAEVAGVKERTLYSWLKNSEFAAVYRNARREATQQAIAQVQQYSGAAVRVILTIMAKDTAPLAVRLAAASKVLDMAIRSVEIEDLAVRLDALERAYAEHR